MQWSAGLIRVAYFESGPYSQVVLSWMEFYFTRSRMNLRVGLDGIQFHKIQDELEGWAGGARVQCITDGRRV